MTNQDRYKTPEERIKACTEFLKLHREYDEVPFIEAAFRWLALEADPVIEPCPFCGSAVTHGYDEMHEASWCQCDNPECRYISGVRPTEAEALAAHNRLARAVKTAKESEVAK